MTNKKNIIFILILTIGLAVFLPLIFREEREDFNQTLNIIGTLISAIAGLLTLLIAIVLLNKFGIETPLLQKSTEVVFSFLEEFKKTSFFIQGKGFGLQVRIQDQHHKHFEDWYAEKLLFSTEYYSGLDRLMKISESPFMPKSIYEKVAKLRFYLLVMDVKDEDLSNYATVQVSGQSLIGAQYGRFNHQDMTLFEFLNILDDLKTEIKSWIDKHSNYSPDLNI
ncbi:MAG: hypothetical protein IPG99_10495 [Ignavibacteria bacterium]|nr:hypothetical protein [Ignavibacteria bacterium]